MPEGVTDRWKDNVYDEFGNVIFWVYTKEVIKSSITDVDISMNWGNSPYYNTLFYPCSGNWAAGGHCFNLDYEMITRSN